MTSDRFLSCETKSAILIKWFFHTAHWYWSTLLAKDYGIMQRVQESVKRSGQHLRSKIKSFQNANFLISQPNPMVWQLVGIVSERRFQRGSHHRVWLKNEKVITKTILFTLSLLQPWEILVLMPSMPYLLFRSWHFFLYGIQIYLFK